MDKKNNVVFSEEPARSLSGGGYIKQRYAMIPVKLSLLLLIFAAWSRFVEPEKQKTKQNKSNLDKQFYSTKLQKKQKNTFLQCRSRETLMMQCGQRESFAAAASAASTLQAEITIAELLQRLPLGHFKVQAGFPDPFPPISPENHFIHTRQGSTRQSSCLNV